jgi:aryl-alcohol dehydrogenase-like predicted oxidoreductase
MILDVKREIPAHRVCDDFWHGTGNMRRASLGALTVSAQGLGCMSMSEYYGPTDWEQSIATVRRAIGLGVTLLDTADIYGAGHNEVLVGRAVAGRRDDVVLSTKFGVDRSAGDHRRRVRGGPDYVRRSCDASLLRLGVDHIDLYYLHRPPQDVDLTETVAAMAELVRAGKVRHIGLCEVDEEQLRRAHSVHPIAAVQSEYSLWSRDVEALAPAMAELGVGLVAFSPLGRGLLAGSVDPGTLTGDDSRRGHPRFQGENAIVNQRVAEVVRSVAQRLGAERVAVLGDIGRVTSAQVALAWIYARARQLGIEVVPIPGTRRPGHLDDNLSALGIMLDDAVLAELEPQANAVRGSRHGALQTTGDPAAGR